MQRYYGINDFFWSTACERHNGYFGSQDVLDETNVRTGHNSWFRFQIKTVNKLAPSGSVSVKYKWSNLTFHISWRHPNTHHILCFDINEHFSASILTAFQTQYQQIAKPDTSTPYLAISTVITTAYDTSVWSLRDWIRDLEHKRMSKKRPEIDYPLLHELTRHTHHSTETITVAVETLSKIRNESHILSSPTLQSKQPRPSPLTFHLSLLQGLLPRSQALEARLKNELNLVINLVAQEQSQATVRIAQATQNDSAAMRAVAVVTLVFLPSTFVSTFFSMSFFSGGGSSGGTGGIGGGWGMSGMVWLYFVITVPMTGMAMLVWFWWERRYRELNSLGG